MRILFAHYTFSYEDKPVSTYSGSMVRELRALGHEVTETAKTRLSDDEYKQFDLLIDVDSGRSSDGKYDWHLAESTVPIPSVAYLIDTHGKPEIHSKVACHADHVFFAVLDKKDIFSDHKSAYWAPCATDIEYFDKEKFPTLELRYDFFFYGSKHGLDRAEPLKSLCEKNNWTYDIRQVSKKGRHQFQATAEAMTHGRVGFNHGQKHDGPNQRVLETMAMGKVIITDKDLRSGMGHLFEPWFEYIPYTPYTCEGLEARMRFAMHRPDACARIAHNAYKKIISNHLIKHRITQVMEVVNAR